MERHRIVQDNREVYILWLQDVLFHKLIFKDKVEDRPFRENAIRKPSIDSHELNPSIIKVKEANAHLTFFDTSVIVLHQIDIHPEIIIDIVIAQAIKLEQER